MSDLTIEVVDRINPVTLAQGEALRRLWRQVVELDLCSSQHEAMRRQLCGETPEVLATLAVEGTAGWTLDLRHGVQVVMRLSRPGARSVQQRVGIGTSRCSCHRLAGARACGRFGTPRAANWSARRTRLEPRSCCGSPSSRAPVPGWPGRSTWPATGRPGA